jgi:valyl-tRNA synthetase
MPFVTEEIYHRLRARSEGDDLAISQFGQLQPHFSVVSSIQNNEVLQLAEKLKASITAIRDARVKNGIKPKETVKLYVQTDEWQAYQTVALLLQKQVAAESFEPAAENIADSITVVVAKDKFFIQSQTPIDTTAQKEQLLKDLDYLKGFLASVEKKLSNERFVQNAKAEIVDAERKKLRDAEEKIKIIEESLSALA